MPNWCSTTYICVGEREEISKLKKILDANAERKTPRVKNDFGPMWLGCIINHLGINWGDCHCRGEITGYRRDDPNTLTICQETAWCEQDGFRHAIEKALPTIKVYYCEEEPGGEVYATNSFEYFPERYYLDFEDGGEYFKTLLDLQKYVEKIVGHEVAPDFEAISQTLDDYAEEQDSDDVWFSLHKFTEVNN